MLNRIADGVLTHQSGFMQSNAVVVDGPDGVLLIDPGITEDELACLVTDLRGLGRRVAAGFSTHPHWDHLLWHAAFGNAPRYATARSAAEVRDKLPDAAARACIRNSGMIPAELVDLVPFDTMGPLTGLPADAAHIPWSGPRVRIVEHRAHADGHAALLIEEGGVLVAGDMLSDILIPILDHGPVDPIGDYLAALQLLDDLASEVGAVVPGHGSVGDRGELRRRVELDRGYVQSLRDARPSSDPRTDPAAPHGAATAEVHGWQVRRFLGREVSSQ